MVGGVEWIRSSAGSEQAAVSGEEMLETEIGGEVTLGCGDAAVIFGTVARQHERLRLVHPLQSFHVKAPDIPFCVDDVRAVRVKVLNRQGCNFWRAVTEVLEVPLGQRKFRRIDGLHDEFLER